MPRAVIFELCAESVQACVAARDGGADRIELCSALELDGLTPSHGLVREVVERSELPVHAMVRPRSGDFLYTNDEFAVMERDVAHLRTLGVSGVVFGLLRPDGRVDVERTARLVEAAGPLEVTFHRAFDQLADLTQGLEDVIGTGCGRVLTSGGAADVVAGVEALARLVEWAAGRIEIALGGGLRLENAAALARTTGARHFHGSLRRFATGKSYVEPEDVRAVVQALREG
jgi:copper homeostasis protein